MPIPFLDSMRLNKPVRLLGTILLSGAFLFLALRGVEWDRLWHALQYTRWLYIPAIFATTIWTLYIRAQRWKVLLHGQGAVVHSAFVHATNIGFMSNMILPLRAGEVIRPVLLSRRSGLPLGTVLASIVLERVFDLLTVIAIFGLAAAFVPVSSALRNVGFLLMSFAVALSLTVFFLRWKQHRLIQFWEWLASYLPTLVSHPVDHFLRAFLQALSVLDHPRTFVSVVGWTFYLWTIIALVNALGLLAFDLPVPLLPATLVVTAVVALAVSAPSAPGYVGSFQFGCKVALAAYAVDSSVALAFSLVLHVTQFLATVAAGLVSLTLEGLSLREIEEVGQTDAVPS